MAGVFESEMLYWRKPTVATIGVAFMLLSLTTSYGDGKTFGKARNLTQWFHYYENVSSTVMLPNNSRGEIRFRTKEWSFLIHLKERNLVTAYLNVLDFNSKYPNPLNSSDIDNNCVYEGVLISPFDGTVFIKIDKAHRELDVMMFTKTQVFVLEPLSKYFGSQKKNGDEGQNVYENIFYKNTDVNLGNIHKQTTIKSKVHEKIMKTSHSESRREKREIFNKTECVLHIVADHLFYQNSGDSSAVKTIALLSYFVSEANQIFRWTDFDGDGSADNIGFHVRKVTIYDGSQAYAMEGKEDIGKYLEAFGTYDFDDYCLGVVFTSIDFDGSVGLAWVASSNDYGTSGGICNKRITYNSQILSLNTNVVTDLVYGKIEPTYGTALTLTHELGHSFGSPHDDANNIACVPENEYGNYIMYPYTFDGSKPNNAKFSPCSTGYIYPVIQNKGTCFQHRKLAICGNGEVEDGEECDCGASSFCAQIDKCCTPSDVTTYDDDKPCTYRRSKGKLCSPKSSRCCTSQCQYMAASENVTCIEATECTATSKCTGTSEICPRIENLPDTTPCRNNRKSCTDGKCVGSICSTYNLTQCFCLEKHACHICCESNTSLCSILKRDDNSYIYRNHGDLCNKEKGFCNRHGECLQLDPDSTIDRLVSLFTGKTIVTFQDWLEVNWYYLIIGAAFLSVVIAIFIATYKEGTTVQTTAFMYGRFMRIQREAELQKEYLIAKRNEAKNEFKEKLQCQKMASQAQSLPESIARLMVFFPTADLKVIMQVIKISPSEMESVSWLLVLGFPFRQFEQPVEENLEKVEDTTDEETEERVQPEISDFEPRQTNDSQTKENKPEMVAKENS